MKPFTGSMFKTSMSGKVRRANRLQAAAAKELNEKAEVRFRDRFCRFPMCGCRKYRLALHVSHKRHKGMGGNPAGDRSTAAGMVYLCSARHKENAIAVDRGTLRWRALTRQGANGPIAWEVDVSRLEKDRAGGARWFEVAREIGPGVWEPYTTEQRIILSALRTMQR